MKKKSAIQKINKNGVLLVFPINNRPEPHSLWSEFYPKSKMLWEWNEDGDNRVGELWLLMKALSDCGDVVYSKWYQNRATFFSKELFIALLCLTRSKLSTAGAESELDLDQTADLSFAARELFDALENDSPLSTKELKKITDLRGKDNEPTYTKALKSLFSRFLIVAYGEVDDGAFPSLAVGSTQLLFEDLWIAAREMNPKQAQKTLDRFMPEGSLFRKFFDKNLKSSTTNP